MNLWPCCWGVVESLDRQIHGPCCAARGFPWPICRVEGSWCWRQYTTSQLETSADGTFDIIITGLLESNTCMTWDLWGVKIWRFWIMMRMERFQDCVGISNIPNFCSTALWFDLMLWKAFSTLRSALAARIVQRREAGYAPENGYL